MQQNHLPRTIEGYIQDKLFRGKTIVIYGPRRIGKTTLVKQLLSSFPKGKYLNCDEPDVRLALTNKSSSQLISYLGASRLIIIDEAQRIKNVGLTLKLLTDNFPDTQVIATGSSSFDLANSIQEPLTGRTYEFNLYPFALSELSTTAVNYEPLLLYGSYPEIVTESDPQDRILHIARNYLYKDALIFQNLKKSANLERLLQAIALQLGSEVSYDELGTISELDRLTVEKYLSILESAFVIFRLRPYSRNPRKEITQKHKVYFWDCGVRNALINNFSPLSLRTDVGPLWENFAIAQTIINNRNRQLNFNYYFWRSYQNQEIDLITEKSGRLSAYEYKFSPRKTPKLPPLWKKLYGTTPYHVMNPDNLNSYLSSLH